jgi:hypothetical protein
VAFDYRNYVILVVDDEPDILRAFRFNYDDEFEILTADSGAEGWRSWPSTDRPSSSRTSGCRACRARSSCSDR